MLIKNYKKVVFLVLCCVHLFMKSASLIPVVFIQVGDNACLHDALLQAKRCNERVILIGDESNKHYAQDGIEYYPISHFNKFSTYFCSIYRHISKTSYKEELAQFTRWFVLDEFMKVNNISTSFYLESNIMLYSDISYEYRVNFNDCDLALEVQHDFCDGSLSFWSSKAIGSFCSFLKEFYEDRKTLDIIEDQFNLGGEQYHDNWPHMTNWMNDNNERLRISNLSDLINNATFDSSISNDYILVYNAASMLEYKRYRMVTANLEIERGNKKPQFFIKDIIWNQGIPYCYSEDLGTFVQFKALPFYDAAKSLIGAYKSIPQFSSVNSEPYLSINASPFYMLSFFYAENQKYLEKFIKDYEPKVIIDLGSWLGASATFMALLMPENGKVYAVDHFASNVDHYFDDKEDQKQAVLASNTSRLYHQFLSNIIHYKLCHKITPVKLSTLEAASSLDVQADLIYIDASTDEESVYQDIMHWYFRLNKNGIVCGSNWKWFESVRNGVIRASQELGKTIKFDNNFWYFDFMKK